MKTQESNRNTAVRVLKVICDSQSHEVAYSEAKEAIRELETNLESGCDFYFDFDGNTYRIIEDIVIWDTYRDEIQNIVEECYDLNLDKVPDFIALTVDWEQTAQNAYADGYGHTFSGYDGSEESYKNYNIFRTN